MKKYFVPPEYEKPMYNTQIWRSYYLYCVAYHDSSVFSETCKELNMPLEHVMADDNWVSNQFATDFLEVLKRRTGDPNIAYNVGAYAASPEVWSSAEYVLLSNTFPGLFYLMLAKQYEKFNHFNHFKLAKWRPGFYQYHVTPKSNKEKAHPEICLNAVGMISCTKHFYNIEDMKVTHDQCVHNGAPFCIFTVKYTAWNFWVSRFKALLIFATTFFAIYGLAQYKVSSSGFSERILLTLSLGASFFASLVMGLTSRYLKILSYSHKSSEQNQRKAHALYESHVQLNRRYQESNLLRELSMKLSGEYDSKAVVNSCLDDMVKRFKYGRAFVMLLSSDKQKLMTTETRGFGENSGTLSNLTLTYPAKKDSPQFFAKILETGETQHISDMDAFKRELKSDNQKLVENLDVTSLIVTPIQDSTSKFGLLVVGSVGEDTVLTEDDFHLVESISRLLSLAFRNTRNLETERGLRSLFQKYVPKQVLEGIDLQSESAGSAGQLAPKNAFVTSMFVDLRDFTSRSEKMRPEKVIDILNIYTNYVTEKIAKHGGIIDKFVGDGVVVFYPENAEGTQVNAALNSAIDILGDIDSLNRIYSSHGFEPAAIGIGLNCGPATIGNMGSKYKLNYTAVGDTVNLAARLQSLSKNYREKTLSAQEGLILVSSETFKKANLPVEFYDMKWLYVPGRTEPVNVYLIDKEQAASFAKGNTSFKKAA